MLFPVDATSKSWISYAGFKGINEFESILTNELINDLRNDIEEVMARVGLLVKNKFLLTSGEWQNHVIEFTDLIINHFFMIREMLYQEIDILKVSSSVLPLGAWMNVDGISFIRLAVINSDKAQTIVLRDGQNEFVLDQQTYRDIEIIDVELDNGMEKIELVVNGALQQVLPFPQEGYGYGLTLDNQYFMMADSFTAPSVVVSMPITQFCLNEIVNRPENQQIAVEVHGDINETIVLGLSLIHI